MLIRFLGRPSAALLLAGLLAAGTGLTGCHSARAVNRAADTCIDPTKKRPDMMCTAEYAPVCGCNGMTYSNVCEAEKAGVTRHVPGPCAAQRDGAPVRNTK